MRQVIFAPDSAYDPIGKLASIHVVQANGPQHANMQRSQLGEPYRPDARGNVGFDNARRVRPLFKRTKPLPAGVARGASVQFAFATYLAQVAEVEVSRDGAVRVRRVVCAVDCGIVVNPDTVRAQIQSAIIFGVTAALHGEITLKGGRVEQNNFNDYRMLRMNETPAIEVYIVNSLILTKSRSMSPGN